jgi:ribosome-associated toxin RatA of RatAB toxin-antitoxin module
VALDTAQEFSVEINATPAQCFDVILDFERYDQWCSTISEARVLERDRAGVGRVVEFFLDMKIRTVRYVLEYAFKRPTELIWHSVDGDVEWIEGRYRFRKVRPATTEATCRQEIRLGFWMPGPLRKLAERTALRQSVVEFKAEVERRVAAGLEAKHKVEGARRKR